MILVTTNHPYLRAGCYVEVATSRPLEFHEQTQPSLESDMIDNLAHPTACSLVIVVRGNYQMELKKGLVYPHRALHDDTQINNDIYVVVKVDMVHENTKNTKLEVPPNDTTLTLWDAITRRVQ
jgi:hypothetical protein